MNVRVLVLVGAVLAGGFAWFAWQQASKRTQATEPPIRAESPMGTPHPPTSSDAGLQWDVPASWTSEPAQGMRLATYGVPGPDGSSDAQCVVFYFGPGQGGGVDANLQRWIGEFENAAAPERSSKTIAGIPVTRIKVKGDYLGHASMGSAPAPGDGKDWTLLGAIAEGPNGSIFYKCTGSSATIAAAEKEFDRMLASLRKT